MELMKNEANISDLIRHRLSPEMLEITNVSARVATGMGMNAYIVGGIVRDLLLGRESIDLDIVVEGDAVKLASSVGEIVRGKVTVHKQFRTATMKWNGGSVDFTTARSETYSKPGALPVVEPGLIDTDLSRRDFTINAMAADLSPKRYGRLIDPFNGREDLEGKSIRILHNRSFIDDATRIWRAIRYEQRLGFEIEPGTLELLCRNLDMMDTVSRDRIRHELELVLKEDEPDKVLFRAGELGVLRNIHSELKGDNWLAKKFSRARGAHAPETPAAELLLALLVYRMEAESIRSFITSLNLRKKQAVILNDLCLLKEKLEIIDESPLQPSATYLVLEGLSEMALTAALIAEESPAIRKNIELYLNEYRHVRTDLTGKDLRDMGFTSGSRIKTVLDWLLRAKIDGEITSREDETALIETIRTSL